MKQLLALLLAMLLAFTVGCGAQPTPPTDLPAAEEQPAPPADLPEAEPELPPEPPQPEPILLDSAEPLDGAGILWRVPCAPMESGITPDLFLWQDYLLLSRMDYAGMNAADSSLKLTLLDLNTGELAAETELNSLQDIQVQTCEDFIAVTDWASGKLLLLDETLAVTAEYTPDLQWYGSCLSSDGSTLYSMTEEGFSVQDLASGTREVQFPRLRELYTSTVCGDTVSFTCVDLDTLLDTPGAIDLSTGEISFLPYDGTCFSVSACGDHWLAAVAGTDNIYLSGTEGNFRFLQPDGYSAELLECGDDLRILTRRGSAEGDLTMSLFTTEGQFLSSASHPLFREAYVTAPIWSERYGGCFFTATAYEGGTQLLFWDLSVPMRGEDLAEVTLPSVPTVGSAVDSALYERAAALSERFGVSIRIADLCETEFYTYTVEQALDEELISTGLDLLEETLSGYPDGFLGQLRYGSCRQIEISLVGHLTPKDLPEDANGFTSFVAFVEEHEGKTVMVLDVTYGLSLKQHIYHEFSHVIDARLEFESRYRADALFSEDTWAALNPEGFDYQWDYHTVDDSIWWDGYDGWFIDAYSRTFPTEDRARILEYAMFGHSYPFTEEGPLREKLTYYAACIRDGFDTEGWPEVTLWEEPLT